MNIEFSELPGALSAVRECAATMAGEAEGLQRALPTLATGEVLRDRLRLWNGALADTAQRVSFELELLRADSGNGGTDTATFIRRLSGLDAAMMEVVAASADLVEQLENEAERDETQEPSFVAVIEMAARLMTACEAAHVATRALRDAVPQRDQLRRSAPVRAAADGSVVVLEVGAEGGSLTLIGRQAGGDKWQFARITDDQSEALFGDADIPVTGPDLTKLAWVDGWEAGLSLIDRYPWVRLSPQYVHPLFRDRVCLALEARLADIDPAVAMRARERWARVTGGKW